MKDTKPDSEQPTQAVNFPTLESVLYRMVSFTAEQNADGRLDPIFTALEELGCEGKSEIDGNVSASDVWGVYAKIFEDASLICRGLAIHAGQREHRSE